eukprot:scaffold598019_cov24-Prasinocladus_malaysianus.AAC.1
MPAEKAPARAESGSSPFEYDDESDPRPARVSRQASNAAAPTAAYREPAYHQDLQQYAGGGKSPQPRYHPAEPANPQAALRQ